MRIIITFFATAMSDHKIYKTEQESFWAGEFGADYIQRNDDAKIIAANLAMFADVISRTRGIDSIIEFGANVGMNLQALRQLLPGASLAAIEINPKAAEHLRSLGYIDVRHQSILEYEPKDQHDLAFIKGVLIHINPEELPTAYDRIYASSKRYVCVAEYYNPTPVSLPYRGHAERLFKRDFAGEMLDRFTDLRLIGYGVTYRRDPNFEHDDINWFLMEKCSN
jgi:pseudaminic acid biosynthesis-associated methylase